MLARLVAPMLLLWALLGVVVYTVADREHPATPPNANQPTASPAPRAATTSPSTAGASATPHPGHIDFRDCYYARLHAPDPIPRALLDAMLTVAEPLDVTDAPQTCGDWRE